MKTCFAYICNAAYLVPALVSARQARRNLAADLADVFVLDIGDASRAGELAAAAAERSGVNYLRFDASVMDGHALTYGRMMLDRMLPDAYEDFVYVDSDTQVWGRLDDLAKAKVPDGRILASRDPGVVLVASGDPLKGDVERHLNGLGLPKAQTSNYINAGVMKVGRRHWSEVARECLAYKERHKDRVAAVFMHSDQDVINTVAGGQFDIVSFRWNFPGFLLRSGLTETCGPRLVHFMSNPRPWHGPFYPWGAAGVQPYAELTAEFPELDPYWPRLTPRKYAKYILVQRYKQLVEGRVWSSKPFHDSFERSEATAAL